MGTCKTQLLKDLLRKVTILDINCKNKELLGMYAEIDTYSKN